MSRYKSMFMPSVMCSNFESLKKDAEFYDNHFSYLHIDVCDGYFCPNIAAGPDIVKAFRRLSSARMDYHFIVNNPERILSIFDIREGDNVTIQLEAFSAPFILFRQLHDMGVTVKCALRPSTIVGELEYLWEILDGVTVMMIEPGYGKQNMQMGMLRKIHDIKNECDKRGITSLEIQVDGNVNRQNIAAMKKNGASQFVLGTSALFSDGYIDEKKYSDFIETYASI